MKFEYRVIAVGGGRPAPEQIERQLNQLGEAGWELVTVLEGVRMTPRLVFKRHAQYGEHTLRSVEVTPRPAVKVQ